MMVGAIVGVGVFGLPFVFAQAGYMLALIELLIIGVMLTVLQLMQAEVALQTEGKHRLVGYTRTYLGNGWSWIVLFAFAAGVWGAMLAYMIVGGKLLFLFSSPLFGGTEFVYAFVIATVASLLIYRGLRFASKIEVAIVMALLFLFLFISLACIPFIRPSSLLSVSLDQAFVPYGVVLFALAGVGIVPELHDVLGKFSRAKLGPIIITGMVLIVVLYAIFSAAVVGVTGAQTTAMAFDGLIPVLGGVFRAFATGLGTLTIVSIYFMLGIELLNTFRFDFRLPHTLSWLIVVIVPVIAYLLGAREFIHVIGFVGSVFSGTIGITIALTYHKMKQTKKCVQHHCINFPVVLTWLLIFLFVSGIVVQIIRLL